eukprot:TRINITY_DN295_c0_g1_i1.p1 TRINITY_DN295_c0_g1~~TRINITY_DN295_c0_g1_i1.p1  ORF type:complete len:409 (+),score=40.01 TRINITY_DN295_c0_g1_i1:78-1304(+)
MADVQDQKKRKLATEDDQNGTQIAEEDIPKIIEPLTQQELLEIARYAAITHPDVLEEVRRIADRDVSRRKIFIRGLAFTTTEEAVNEVFGRFGEIEGTSIPLDKSTGKSKGYAFVTYKHIDAAINALKEPNKLVDGKSTACNLASAGGKQTLPQIQLPQALSALNPTSTPNPNFVAPSDASNGDVTRRKIYIKGLGPDTTKDAINEVFGKFGEIEDTNLPVDKATGKNKGYAFVTFKTVASAVNALKEPNKTVNGCKTACNLAVVGSRQTIYNEQLQQLQQQQLLQQQQQLQQSLAAAAVNPLQTNVGYPFSQQGISGGYMTTGGLNALPSAFNSTALASAALGSYNLSDTSALSSLPRDTSPLLQGLGSRPESASATSLYGSQLYGGVGSGVASLYGTSNPSRFLPG